MAKKVGLAKYVKNATAQAGFWDPPAGWRGRCKVDSATVKINAKDNPRWSLLMEVLEGEDKGRKFFINLGFSDSDIGNGITLGQFAELGIDETVIGETDADQLCTILEGAVAIVIAKYRKDTTDPTKEWSNHTMVAAADEKPARPKSRRKAKAEEPAPTPAPEETKAPEQAPAPTPEPVAAEETKAVEPVAAAEPVAEAKPEPAEEPKKPKRRGWWSLGR